MKRRDILRASAGIAPALLAAPALAQRGGADARTLRVIPHANPGSLDPIWTTANITRIHGFLVWDTLYGQDGQFGARPQMAEGHEVSDDGLLWRIRLRPGLFFHDGEPVRARDCAASLERWGRRDAMGQRLVSLLAEPMRAEDDRTLAIRLSRPFGMLPDALARIGSNVPFIMPERIARTDAFAQIPEVVGSGPFRFRREEYVSGAFLAYERFERYAPRDEPADWTAGGKRALVDRVEWRIVPDAATAASALRSGEVDWLEQPAPDLIPVLRRDRGIQLQQINTLGEIGTLRFNHLHPPFDRAAVRRAVAMAASQADWMTASVGTERERWREGVGVFVPGTPLASDEGMSLLTGPRDLAAARRALAEAGYDGQRVVLLGATDLPITFAQAQVTEQLLRGLGMTVEFVATDWGSIVQRRASREPVERGGWSLFHTFWLAFDHLNPSAHLALRGHGADAWFGWPTDPEVERLREAWFDAPDLPAQQRIAREIQASALRELPYVPTGQWFVPTAHRHLRGVIEGPGIVFWNVAKG